MKKSSIIILLIAIVIFAACLRFYNLGSNPPSLTWDEAAWGYNAYSLGIDGKDEFGKFLPITYLESFGDFKPPLYAYLDIFPVKLFGLNEFATRFPSAFFGVLTVLLTFFLVKEIFPNFERKKVIPIALISSLLLAISPWHILLSRAAFEANVASFLIVLGVFLFLYSIKRRSWLFVFSIVSFVLSMYTFNTARIVVPLLVLGLTIGMGKEIIGGFVKKFIVSAVVGFIIFLPLLLFLLTPQASLRYQEVNIFTDPSIVQRSNQEIENDNQAFWSKVIHNRRVNYGIEYLKHYFDNLKPDYLFIKGDGNPKFSIQDVGQMYIWEIPFFLSGLFIIFRKRGKYFWIIPYWLIVGIIPAGVARETPHALRTETILPTIQIITAIGLFFLISNMKKEWGKINIQKIAIVAIILIAIFNFLYFYHNYFAHYSNTYSGEWQYGYKQAVNYTNSVSGDYDKIAFTTDLGRPYIYFLFYNKYDPALFAKNANIYRESLGFVHVNSFSKYIFSNDLQSIKRNDNKILYVDVPDKVSADAKILKEFKLLNGKPALTVYE